MYLVYVEVEVIKLHDFFLFENFDLLSGGVQQDSVADSSLSLSVIHGITSTWSSVSSAAVLLSFSHKIFLVVVIVEF